LGNVEALLDGGNYLGVVGEKLAVVVNSVWHIVDEQGE